MAKAVCSKELFLSFLKNSEWRYQMISEFFQNSFKELKEFRSFCCSVIFWQNSDQRRWQMRKDSMLFRSILTYCYFPTYLVGILSEKQTADLGETKTNEASILFYYVIFT